MMSQVRFVQIHTLHSYPGALLNRDDSGLAKRLPFGGTNRTRISSQCLKRHWRIADDVHALDRIDGATAAYRSRELVTRKVIDPLRDSYAEDVVEAVEREFQVAIYGDKGTVRKSRQTVLLGAPELDWLAAQAQALAADVAESEADATADVLKAWRESYRANARVMREGASLPAGLVAAMFGRMMTSDPDANITAAVHVSHAFTVHAEEPESDYFTAVDDLDAGGPGADMIQDTELTTGIYYGYVVVDLQCLLDNLGGDTEMAGHVLHNLVYLIAEVSPGSKRGSTAPYGRASLILCEAGERQPRSLAEAYRAPCAPDMASATNALVRTLAAQDAAYETGEERRALSVLPDANVPGAELGSLADLAGWARSLPERAAP